MSTREFELHTHLAVPAERVIDFLADIPRQGRLHPFLVRAVAVGQQHGTTEYAVVERPTLGPLRYRTRFTAWVRRVTPTSLRTEVRVGRLVRLEVTTTAEPDADGTALHERTVVRTPAPLLAYVARQAEVAHRQVFERLPEALAGEQP